VTESPAIAPDGSEVSVDIAAFNELAEEIGRDDTLQTFSIFFDEADRRLKRLRELSCDADRPAIGREAHGLKGTAANFGLRRVAALAAVLEKDAQTITPDNYEATLRNIETSYAAARARFAELIG
jgi:HPt (histidine-containing phosphotransfer) domain-containing protein